jgi:Short-chain dehydrogenases of various substrate specificities
MSGRLSGKHALITAAGAGIGRATALAFADAGASVLATDIDAEALASLAAAHPSITTQVLDVTDPAAIASLVGAAGPLDTLFNCAGYVHAGTILETDEASWKRSFSINVDSMFHLCKAVLPGMLERGGGSIVNMSSVASSIKGVPNRFAYSATKAAVIGLTRSIAADFVARGVRCNAICPGTVKTPFAGAARARARRRSRSRVAQLHRPPADGPARPAGRNRRAGVVPRFGRSLIHHRHHPRRGWRLVQLTGDHR